jgi:hypothetical protein
LIHGLAIEFEVTAFGAESIDYRKSRSSLAARAILTAEPSVDEITSNAIPRK